MCRLLTQCVTVPIWGVCQCWYAPAAIESFAYLSHSAFSIHIHPNESNWPACIKGQAWSAHCVAGSARPNDHIQTTAAVPFRMTETDRSWNTCIATIDPNYISIQLSVSTGSRVGWVGIAQNSQWSKSSRKPQLWWCQGRVRQAGRFLKVTLARFYQSFKFCVKLSEQTERSSETTYFSCSRMASSSLFEGQS
jgi:hypothetical protein